MLFLNCNFYGSIVDLKRSTLRRFFIFKIRSDFVTRALRRSALGFDSAYAPLKMTNGVGRKRLCYSGIITLRRSIFAVPRYRRAFIERYAHFFTIPRIVILECSEGSQYGYCYQRGERFVRLPPGGRDALRKYACGIFLAKAGSKLCLRPWPKAVERMRN